MAEKPAASIDVGKYDVDEHNLTIDEVAEKYETHIDTAAIIKSKGLSNEEAAKRLATNGPNKLTPPKTLPEWAKYLLQFTNPLLMLLVIAGVLAFVAYGIQEVKDLANIWTGVVLIVLVFGLATKKYITEIKATRTANSLRSMLPSVTLVVRNGQESQIPVADLVVGDIVHMVIGSKVPADLKVIEVKDLKLDFSSLTGEADPIPMSITAADHRPHESHNIAFMSSQVLNGEGRGVVIRVGDATFIGKINTLTAGTTVGDTTLVKDIRLFVSFIAVTALTFALTLFGIGLGRGAKFADAFVNGLVVVVVAFIPQGLPSTVATMLGAAAEKMKEKRVVAKKADILEALGAASRIASDKTGTLTQNKMTVMNCWVNRQYKSARDITSTAAPINIARVSRSSGGNNNAMARPADPPGLAQKSLDINSVELAMPPMMPGPSIKSVSMNRFGTDQLSRMSMGKAGVPGLGRTSAMTFAINLSVQQPVPVEPGSTVFSSFSPLSQLLTIACCNNKAQFAADPNAMRGQPRKVLGDATDCGLLRFCDQLVDVDGTRNAFAQVYAIPFNSKNKWALTMVTIPGDEDHYLAMIKGAPEYVLQRCKKFQYKGKELDIDNEFTEDMMEAYESFGTLAERVIGHAFKVVKRSTIPTIPSNQEEAEATGMLESFTFAGLLSLIDPPRDAVPPAVEQCRSAGVGVTMVTGDHPLTAEAIARKCHIITTPTRREVAAEYGIEEEQVPIDDPNVQALVVTGAMIDATLHTDEDWDKIMDKDELVFARTTPQQKLLIVSHFQRRGEVVAVTGDGVNDSPALRRADIGVAMGNPDASEVAREAADIVLLDDDFSALVYAIAEGRCLYDNLKKTIAYTVTHTSPEFAAVFMNLALGMPLGLGAMLVLSIDLGTEQGPANSLAHEPPEANLMERAPRNIKTQRLVSVALLSYSYAIIGTAESLVCIGAYLWTFRLNGVSAQAITLLDPKLGYWPITPGDTPNDFYHDGRVYTQEEQSHIVRQANSAWYITLVMCQFWHIWFCKTRRVSVFQHSGFATNKTTYVGVFCALTIMSICAYVPALQEHVFNNADPPALAAWVPHLFFLAFISVYTETCKYFARTYPNGFVAKWIAW